MSHATWPKAQPFGQGWRGPACILGPGAARPQGRASLSSMLPICPLTGSGGVRGWPCHSFTQGARHISGKSPHASSSLRPRSRRLVRLRGWLWQRRFFFRLGRHRGLGRVGWVCRIGGLERNGWKQRICRHRRHCGNRGNGWYGRDRRDSGERRIGRRGRADLSDGTRVFVDVRHRRVGGWR